MGWGHKAASPVRVNGLMGHPPSLVKARESGGCFWEERGPHPFSAIWGLSRERLSCLWRNRGGPLTEQSGQGGIFF